MDYMTKTVEKHSDNDQKAMQKKQSGYDALSGIYNSEYDRTEAFGYIRYPNDRPVLLQTLPVGSDMPIQRAEPASEDDFVEICESPQKYRINVSYNLYTKYKIAFRQINATIQRISVPGSSADLFNNIKMAFGTRENIHTIIGKMFSGYTGATLRVGIYAMDKSTDPKITGNILNNLQKPISETLNDILHWTVALRKTGVEEIVLTDSDVHYRGIGVCIVTFSDNQKYVIKPGDKSFERAVYGKQEGSIATEFKSIMGSKGFAKIVGQLDIQSTKEHGSAVEYFKHIDKEGKPDFVPHEAAYRDIIEFASLLGLADLHHENLGYDEETHIPQMIDAEVGLKYLMNPDNPLSSSTSLGEIGDSALDYQEYYNNPDYIQTLIDFLRTIVLPRLNGLKCRRIIFETIDLYGWRIRVYQGMPFDAGFYCNKLEENPICRTHGWKVNYKCIVKAHEKMCIDYKKGIIPFYEHDLSTGNIEQVFSDGKRLPILVNEEQKPERIISKNIEILKKKACL